MLFVLPPIGSSTYFSMTLLFLSATFNLWTTHANVMLEHKGSPAQYAFGQNWMQYMTAVIADPPLSGVDLEARVQSMAAHLKDGFGFSTFKGRTFLDFGCGSGLASLAAISLGAVRVTSVDYQKASVDAAELLRRHVKREKDRLSFGDVENWEEVLQGDVLDPDFIDTLPVSDLVYSYGVVHHTGDVWSASRNLARLVEPQLGFLLIWTHVAEAQHETDLSSWFELKRDFQTILPWEQQQTVLAYAFSEIGENVMSCIASSSPSTGSLAPGTHSRFVEARRCMQKHFASFTRGARGMDVLTDTNDWLGGYPYQTVRTAEFIEFMLTQIQPSMKTLIVHHSAVAGFLLAPALSSLRSLSVDGLMQTAWSAYKLIDISPEELIDIRSVYEHLIYREDFERHLEEAEALPRGPYCWMYLFPSEHGEVCTNPGDYCVSDRSVVLKDSEILGWGGGGDDGLFCKSDGGARYRFFPEGVIIAPGDDSDPFSGRHKYQVLKITDKLR
eukprot:TRINITY_DN75183_c0_g1_i1.p1 TRINITY_DN75183_c0_g1~~TRINITY_DN75183_c0_g1_i1.p1  ORF type:complete len:500 (+),score=59.05 TRINITY_DN75183_c0_g1_i1:96-1595(+)